MKTWGYRITLAFILALVFYWLYPNSEPNPRPTWWDIEQSSTQNISVLGLELPASSMQAMAIQFLSTPSIAMFTKRQRPNQEEPAMHVEAYFEDVYDEGDRIVLGLAADAALLKHIKKSALRPEIFPNDVIRVNIPEELNDIVAQLPIKSVTIIAGRQVRFEDFKAKFGEPSQILDDGMGNAHFLYPNFGLDFIQPADGLQVLQFVAPSEFESQLLAPLHRTNKSQTNG